MTNAPKQTSKSQPGKLGWHAFQRWFARNLRVDQARKQEIYFDLLQSVTLQDVSYWLQVLFSAGIATLGLVLNSPAVIIGAMLISPLMGPILANGLAFSTGDVVLAIRALMNLALSCLMAIAFAVLLIALMPFKEVTSEIQARISPNLLDLLVALFSGALGAVMTSKQSKGVATSIPGVAIAVALMPPLCVVGYGTGFALSENFSMGIRTAVGGGLLFITNLTAITFTAAVVFLLLNMGTAQVTNQVRAWHEADPESNWIETFLEKLPITGKLRTIGSLRSRLLILFIPIAVLLIPLSLSLARLQSQVALKQQQNLISREARELWSNGFDTLENGQPRSFIEDVVIQSPNRDKLLLQMRVFTSKGYSNTEKVQFETQLAKALGRPRNTIQLSLIQIPTTSNELLAQATAPPPLEATPPRLPSVAETQSEFLQTVDSAMQSLVLPVPAELLHYAASTSAIQPLTIEIVYLSTRQISADAISILQNEIRNRLQFATLRTRMIHIPAKPVPLAFEDNRSTLTPTAQLQLDQLGEWLQQAPTLQLTLAAELEDVLLFDSGLAGTSTIAQARYTSISNYLESRWQIEPERLQLDTPEVATDEKPKVRLTLQVATFDEVNFTSPDTMPDFAVP